MRGFLGKKLGTRHCPWVTRASLKSVASPQPSQHRAPTGVLSGAFLSPDLHQDYPKAPPFVPAQLPRSPIACATSCGKLGRRDTKASRLLRHPPLISLESMLVSSSWVVAAVGAPRIQTEVGTTPQVIPAKPCVRVVLPAPLDLGCGRQLHEHVGDRLSRGERHGCGTASSFSSTVQP